MSKEIVEVPVLSQGVRNLGVPLSLLTKANGFVFVSGTPPFDLETGKFVRGDIDTQTEASLKGLAEMIGQPRPPVTATEIEHLSVRLDEQTSIARGYAVREYLNVNTLVEIDRVQQPFSDRI